MSNFSTDTEENQKDKIQSKVLTGLLVIILISTLISLSAALLHLIAWPITIGFTVCTVTMAANFASTLWLLKRILTGHPLKALYGLVYVAKFFAVVAILGWLLMHHLISLSGVLIGMIFFIIASALLQSFHRARK